MAGSGRDDAVTAGRGFLLIAGAKAYFILSSALLALGLPRFLGPNLFGEYKVVSSFISILNMVLIVGTIQTVSRLVSEDPARVRCLRVRALLLQIAVGGLVAGAILLFAEELAVTLFRDAALAPLLRVASAVPFLYALYAVFVGLLNGLRRFAAQAAIDTVFSTLKVGLIVGMVLSGFGVMGAFAGYVAASGLTLCAAVLVVARRLPDGGVEQVPVGTIAVLLAPILVSTLMTNVMLQVDVLGIKGMMHAPVAGHLSGHAGAARLDWLVAPLGMGSRDGALDAVFAKQATDHLAGVFGGAKNVSLLPYQATFALTLVVFPLLSSAAFAGDRARSAAYVRHGLRFTLLLGSALCVALGGTARPVLSLLLGPEYAAGAHALALMLVAGVLLSLLVLCITLLNAGGAERLALLVSGGTVALGAVLLFVLLRTSGDLEAAPLERAAIGTLTAMAAGLCAAGLAVRRRFGAFVPLATVLRVLLCSGALLWPATLWPVESIFGLVSKAAVLGVGFLGLLAVCGEIGTEDRAAVSRILGASRRAAKDGGDC